MSLTANEIKEAFKAKPTETAHLLGVMLRDIGYWLRLADDSYVEAEINRLLDGGQPMGSASMFLSRWLEEGIK